MVIIKSYSIIEEFILNGINFFLKDEFNFSSFKSNDVTNVSVCLFNKKNDNKVQLIYSVKELVDINKIRNIENDQSLSLNREFSPRENSPFGDFHHLQPFLKDQNVETIVSSHIENSKFVIVKDLSKNKSIVVETKLFLSIFIYKAISFNQDDSNQVDKITLNVGMEAIEKASKDSNFGSITIKNSHTESKITKDISKIKDVLIPIFPSTSEEILIISDENSFVDIEYIISLFGIDHLLETAFLIKAHSEYKELKNFSISMSEIIAYVGIKQSFRWMIEIANDSNTDNMNEDFIEFYFKFASYINVASEICSNIISFIIKNEQNLQGSNFNPEKIIMVSRLINFPIVLLATNSSKKDYAEVIDHIIINPKHNSMEICDIVLGYNEIDLVSALLSNNLNLPDFIKNTLLEQYNPMYNGKNSIYPNLNYIASSIMSLAGMTQSSVFSPSKKMSSVLANRIGISEDTIKKIEDNIHDFKEKAIQKNKIHVKKKLKNQNELKNYFNKFILTVF